MKKTIKKRAFVSAIAMLIVSAIVLTSSTFAWFSMSKEASVESMDLTVSSPEGIQISANASAWTAQLTVDQIFNTDVNPNDRYNAYPGNNNLYPTDLIPVSSAFKAADSATGYADFFKAAANDTNTRANITTVTQSKDSQDAAGLIAFDLFFKVAEEKSVKFSDSVFTDNSNSDIKTALRVAFTPLGNVAIGTDAATAQALNSFASGTKNVVYEVDSVNRSADAAEAGLTAGAKTTSGLTSTNGGSAPLADGIITAGTCTSPVAGTLVADTADASAKAFKLDAGITKVRVYIWVEGNDVDCLNSVSGASLTAALKFTID